MIDIRGLTKQADDKPILRGVDLSVEKGETIAILGPNGAGKSTILKVLATLMKPTSGIVRINGLELKRNANELRKLTGYLPHSSLLYEQYSPLENLTFYASAYGMQDARERALELVSRVGLSYFQNEPVKNFSRGMIQRVAIARAIIHDPLLLLLDEPHTGLDQGAIAILNEVIQSMKSRGTTTLMVTHDLKQAARICERAIIIKHGRIADDFHFAEKDEEVLSEAYFRLTEAVS